MLASAHLRAGPDMRERVEERFELRRRDCVYTATVRQQWALGNADVWLTAEESRQVAAALLAVIEPYRSRALRDRPEGSRRVRVATVVVPHRNH